MSTCLLRSTTLIVASVAALAGCGSSNGGSATDGTIDVVASTNVYGDIASTIGGDDITVTSIIDNADQDPHSYEASNQTLLRLSKADVVIENGGGYDDFVDRMIKATHSSPTVLNAVDISGDRAPAGGELNEHVWYDLAAAKKIAGRISEAFAKSEPRKASTFSTNLKAFDREVDTLIDQERELARSYHGDGVGITEPVPLYMLEALGLVNKTSTKFSGAVEEGEDVSVAVLSETLGLYTNHDVKALVYNAQTSGPVTEKVKSAAESAGIPTVPVTETLPKGLTYVTWMRSNLDHLDKALKTT